jgi:hypothetical protein
MNTFPDNTIRSSIQQFFEQEINGQQLLRTFMGYDQWHIPAAFDPEGRPVFSISRYENGERWFHAFTDHRAIQEYEAALGKDAAGEYFITTTGWSIFSQLDETLDGVNINPHTALALHYRQHQLPTLKNWAEAVRLETAIATPDKFSDPFKIMKDFSDYRMVLFESGRGTQIALAPDPQGRKLAPIFTAEDTVNGFLEYLQDAATRRYPAVRILAQNGSRLFSQLRDLPLDGIVFNPKGPIPPRAFGSAIIQYILAA